MKYKSFSLNSEFYRSVLADLKRAKSKIYLETYIFAEDEIGGKIREILTEKASRGVTVKLLVDAIGSPAISELNFTKLILAGGDVNFFRRLLLMPFHLTKLNNRNHRKLILIDDRISYIGSANISQETSFWREFNLRIDDLKINKILSRIFIEQFLISNTLTMNKEKSIKVFKANGLTILRSTPFAENPIKDALWHLISEAKKEIIIENPYIVVDKKTFRHFKQAIGRKVKIKIILPTRIDINMMSYLNDKFIQKARKMGIEIYFYSGMLHSKIILVDNEKWMFGSANLDYRSLFTQFEIMIRGKDKEIKKIIRKHINESLKKSKTHAEKKFKKTTFKEKIIGNLLYFVRFLF